MQLRVDAIRHIATVVTFVSDFTSFSPVFGVITSMLFPVM
jgi:hypothetical protein